MNKALFRHSTKIRVRNYEVDWQGVVHNANYLLYFEIGRVEYLKHLGIRLDLNSIRNENRVVLVRNEINYSSPAYFDDLLDIYTRIAGIRDTSFVFEGIIEKSGAGGRVSDNVATHVWLNPENGSPKRVSEGFRRIIRDFEGPNVQIEGAESS